MRSRATWRRSTGRRAWCSRVQGRIDHDGLVAAAEEAFTALPEGPTAAPAAAIYGGGDCRVPRDLEQAHVVVGFDGLAYDDDDLYALQVLSTLLGGGMSSRLFQEIRERRGLAYSVFTFSSSYADGGIFGVYAGAGEDQLAELIPVMADELMGACATVGEEEVARAPRPAQGRPPDVAGEPPRHGQSGWAATSCCSAGPLPIAEMIETRRCHRPRGGAPHCKPHPGRVPADGHGARADRHAGKP